MQTRQMVVTLAGLVLALAATPARGEGFTTGPEVGEKIPDFRVQDHKGRTRSFADLTGPEGLLLLFHRSADW